MSRSGRSGYATARAALAALLPGCTPLTAFNAVVPKEIGVARVVRDAPFGDHARQRIDVYAPRGRARAARPMILFLYGGSWASGAKSGYGFVGRALAAKGFIVGIPDYRIVPDHRFPDFLEDNAAAFRWLRKHAAEFGGDPDRIVLAGHSAGAYNAAMLAMDPQWLAADRPAVRGWFGLSGPYDFLPLKGSITRRAFGAWPDPPATQPITHASAGDPPAFLATGADDRMVLPSNGEALGERLGAAGVPVTVQSYPRLGHVGAVTAFAMPFRHRAPVLRDLVAFARKVTGEK
jgi:acetyl esterase/lipase